MTTAAVLRAHVLATVVTGAVAAGLVALALLQVLVPGVFHDAPWLGYGRLATAQALALCGLAVNGLFVFLYRDFPNIAERATRSRIGEWVFSLWNVAVVLPAVWAALAGLLPPSGALGVLWTLSTIHVSAVALVLWMNSSRLSRPGPTLVMLAAVLILQFSDIATATVRSGGPRLGVLGVERLASFQNFWIAQMIGTLLMLGWAIVRMHALATGRQSIAPAAPVARTRGDRIFSALGILVLAFWPFAMVMDARSEDPLPAPTTVSESRGREIYVREGCASCHNGSRDRIGADLSRENGVRPADWHYAHLFLPALVTPKSVMPSYAHLFDGAPTRPTLAARDLVAYIDSMGRAENLAATEAVVAETHPARARRSTDVPVLPTSADAAEGQRLFATHCFSCHGARGEGDGPVAAALRPRPANLAAHRLAPERVTAALWNGVAGTAMPAWRDLRLDRVAALVAYVTALGERSATTAAASTPAPGPEGATVGATVYAAHCTQCHGASGGGDGFSAASLPIAPANFQWQQPSLDYALRVIAGGVDGTPMAPWTSRISEQELLAVAHYVRTFYREGGR